MCDPSRPLTDAADAADVDEGGGVEIVTSDTKGLMVVTQTCDIRRDCFDRPYIEVCPLISVDKSKLDEIKNLRRPSYASLEVLSARCLVADLDRVMTVEKAVLAAWDRTPGCKDDAEAMKLARALARKRDRFAFPTEFSTFVEKLLDRITDKHNRNSPEGEALRSLSQIRVSADPSWKELPATPTFWFVRKENDTTLTGEFAAEMLERWLLLMPATESFLEPVGQLTRLSEMKADEYLASVRLDLDHLSHT
ncbi:MAG: hypothetical protein HQ464_03760 [Planctomycetes bacterium]|nr:hypothetical protein [Planctomycetota bacterium]